MLSPAWGIVRVSVLGLGVPAEEGFMMFLLSAEGTILECCSKVEDSALWFA